MNEIMINAGLLIDEIESEQNNLFEPADYIGLIERLAENASKDLCALECNMAFRCPYFAEMEGGADYD